MFVCGCIHACILSRSDRSQRSVSWRDLFREFYAELGRYMDHYVILKRAWDALKAYLDQRCPRMIASLKGETPSSLAWNTHTVHEDSS